MLVISTTIRRPSYTWITLKTFSRTVCLPSLQLYEYQALNQIKLSLKNHKCIEALFFNKKGCLQVRLLYFVVNVHPSVPIKGSPLFCRKFEHKILVLYKDFRVRGVPKKGIDQKLSVGAAHDFNSQFLEFIWIQYICKFCLVYHLKDLGTSR